MSVQKAVAFERDDDYVMGLYNGMELVFAIVEDRDPTFLSSKPTPPKPPKTIHELNFGGK